LSFRSNPDHRATTKKDFSERTFDPDDPLVRLVAVEV
jgi:hypothetical protein